MSGNHPDIIYVEHEKPNVISVDNIRQQVNGDISIKPYSGAHKIYIIDEAEKMNVQAQNALLKTLEEPPEYAVILLLATRVEAMLHLQAGFCMFRKGNMTEAQKCGKLTWKDRNCLFKE